MSIFNFFASIFCKQKDAAIASLQHKLAAAQRLKEQLHTTLTSAQSDTTKVAHCKTLLATDASLAFFWNTKYPQAKIVHEARSLPFSDQTVAVPVNTLITPHDPYIIDDLKRWGFYLSQEDPETLVPKLYKKIKESYFRYKEDTATWGKNEVWEFPFEMRSKGFGEGYDCEGWGVLQASYYIAAGIPSWRVRCVAGDTKTFGGHMTVYVFSLVTKQWHHLNSTYGHMQERISTFPTHDDARAGNDPLGIREVWFSFTDKSAFHNFTNPVVDDRIRILH